jgi:hypothetical protein
MTTYKETILRYRIVRHDELPESHKAEYRAAGIDPDDNWSLVWSFADLKSAESCLAREQEEAPKWRTYKLVDGGAAETVEREAWF